jgi:hypothetical protein
MNARLSTSVIATVLTTGILLGPAFAQAPTPIVRPIPVPNEFKTSDNADARVLKQVPGGVVLNVRSPAGRELVMTIDGPPTVIAKDTISTIIDIALKVLDKVLEGGGAGGGGGGSGCTNITIKNGNTTITIQTCG